MGKKELKLKKIGSDSPDKVLLEAINQEAIPDEERASLDDMFSTGTDTDLDILEICRDEEPVGFLAVRIYKSIRYLAYFAVRKDLRSQGIGSEALQLLILRYEGAPIVVEFEAPEKDREDIRTRRKNFYLCNGFHDTGWYNSYDGTEFEVGCTGDSFDIEMFCEFADYLSSIIEDHIPHPYRKGEK
ncbi:MAG: GNAT family N-acetyltransferase [Oscillospiraceae bacterium]|nr:GNAT family N-acetyltransferase [Oscillospiraceae bacterium]